MNLSNSSKQNVLIIGIAGGLAQLTAKLILSEFPHWTIYGIDSRDTSLCPKVPGLNVQQIDYTRGTFENLFRKQKFHHVLQLGRLNRSSEAHDSLARRLELNVMGTDHLLELCFRWKIETALILSSFHIYGAKPENPAFLDEDSPIKGNTHFTEIREAIQVDQVAQSWMWKHQTPIRSIVLRPCNIIGSKIQNAISRHLTAEKVVSPLDYNPQFQFIHEYDMARIILHALNYFPKGTYNVATDEHISLRKSIKLVGSKPLHLPLSILGKIQPHLPAPLRPKITPYLIDYLKYPCLVDNSLIKKYLPSNFFRFSVEETLKLLHQ